jgi:hypothetical protein
MFMFGYKKKTLEVRCTSKLPLGAKVWRKRDSQSHATQRAWVHGVAKQLNVEHRTNSEPAPYSVVGFR